MSIDDFERQERMTVEMQGKFVESVQKDIRHMQHFAHVESSRYRNQLILIIAFAGLALNTILASVYTGTARGEAFGLIGTGFGLVTALVNLAWGPPVPPTEELAASDPFVVRAYNASRRIFYLSFPLVAFWLGMMTWRAVSLWRLR